MTIVEKVRCVVCSREVPRNELHEFSEAYAHDGIEHMCEVCLPWVCRVVAVEKVKISLNVQNQIRERAKELQKHSEHDRVSMQKEQADLVIKGQPLKWMRFFGGICDL